MHIKDSSLKIIVELSFKEYLLASMIYGLGKVIGICAKSGQVTWELEYNYPSQPESGKCFAEWYDNFCRLLAEVEKIADERYKTLYDEMYDIRNKIK